MTHSEFSRSLGVITFTAVVLVAVALVAPWEVLALGLLWLVVVVGVCLFMHGGASWDREWSRLNEEEN